ncbi:MAG TPA: thioredoxin-like domain-containing protein [Bacteroidota bacterium]|nr:thioredoxin-like domain-containing protein [Bacteroidota bacterium]
MKHLLISILLLFISATLLSQESVVSGKVAGYDGNPLKKANVDLYSMSDPAKALASVEVGFDGSFKISTTEQGTLRLQVAGVDHLASNIPLLIEKPSKIGINVRLATYPFGKTIESAQIIGDFNDFSMAKPKAMAKQPDGTFTADFETEKSRFKYQIFNVFTPPRSINGTQSEDYEYDGGGDYQSVVTPKNGKVLIVFDPHKVPRSDVKEKVTFNGKGSVQEKFLAAYNGVMEAQQGAQKAAVEFQKSGKDMKTFHYDVSGPLKTLAEKLRKARNPFDRQLLLMQYLGISPIAKEGVDSSIVRQALTEIPAESGIWSVSPGLIISGTRLAGSSFDAETYMDGFTEKNRDRTLKSRILFDQMMTAKYGQKEEQYKKYYRKLVEGYGDTQYGQMAKQRMTMETAITLGKTVPEFKLASLEDAQSTISNDLLKGKITMLDFWAVWCGPCIGEMESMHKAYERFKGKTFQIISFSFDPKPEDVVKFREKKWKMPWLHAFIEKGFESDLAKRFEVIGIPKPILVDGEGKILAMENELRGEELERTLEKFLGK